MAQTAMIINAHPSLNGFTNDIAETRACPDAPPVGTFPATVTLDIIFNNCTPDLAVTFTNMYNGTINLVFNAEMKDDVAGPEFTMTTTGITINNGTTTYTIASAAPIEFELNEVENEITYDYELTGDVTVSDGTYTTTYPSNSTGHLRLVNNGDDVVTDPSTYIDNEFRLGIDPTKITCHNGVTDMDICIKTHLSANDGSPSSDIGFSLQCGCPFAGRLRVDDPNAGGTCNVSDGSYDDHYDFGSDIDGNRDYDCDNYYELNDGGSPAVGQLTSCGD